MSVTQLVLGYMKLLTRRNTKRKKMRKKILNPAPPSWNIFHYQRSKFIFHHLLVFKWYKWVNLRKSTQEKWCKSRRCEEIYADSFFAMPIFLLKIKLTRFKIMERISCNIMSPCSVALVSIKVLLNRKSLGSHSFERYLGKQKVKTSRSKSANFRLNLQIVFQFLYCLRSCHLYASQLYQLILFERKSCCFR